MTMAQTVDSLLKVYLLFEIVGIAQQAVEKFVNVNDLCNLNFKC